ncbi:MULTISPECIES: septation protein A [unclassified Beijerinckia]|uniref:septation protein A n=1 Tax=unclassified Beijerinckia TaxID=2638183 RepID=UPI000899260E|nr:MULTISPECIES: septation protein A [unclassified Beijerinckia]MDH7798227.1 intracellular septation protein [Beijerinckia sp. GAS462]SED13577.1 intracellular septation protein [Beijerinckia sp. 28-YEA-48]
MSTEPTIAARTAAPKQNPMLKLALEMGPLVLFFLANSRPALFRPLLEPIMPASLLEGEKAGIFAATLVLMISVVVSLLISWRLTKRLPVMPVVTCIAVVFFGVLTFLFHDDLFIKLKPTIVNAIFGAVLLGSLAFGKLLLPVVLDSVMHLTEEGWRKLTVRWGLFFFVLAALNEIVWRTQTTDFWVSFKVFGIMPLTIIFALSQVPLILKYEVKNPDAE